MFRKICFKNIFVMLAAACLILVGCDQKPVPRTVLVSFEIQLINASSSAWGFGIVGGKGRSGFGATNKVIRDSVYATVGERVFIKAFGKHWHSKDPAHQIIGRILVKGEEIYMCADQGYPGKNTKIECGGPVYIPKSDR